MLRFPRPRAARGGAGWEVPPQQRIALENGGAPTPCISCAAAWGVPMLGWGGGHTPRGGQLHQIGCGGVTALQPGGTKGKEQKKRQKPIKIPNTPPKKGNNPPSSPPPQKKEQNQGENKRNKSKLTPPGCKEPFGWTPTVLLCAPPAAQPPQPCLPPSAALCRPSAAATPTGPHPSRRGTPPCRVVRGGLLSPAPQRRWPQRAAAARSNDGPGTSHRRRIS